MAVRFHPADARHNRATWLAASIPSLVSLAVYVATLRPEFDWGDSAELTLQAYQLGVTHPPGYPVHTFLGKLFILLFADAMVATNLLSAVCTCLAAGLLTVMAHRLTGDWWASVLAGLIFAFVPQVWDMAVVTEVYGVNICFIALALFLMLSWYQKPSTRLLLATSVAFGVSLGSYLANILVLPAFVFLIWRQKQAKLTHIVLFLTIIAITGGLILSWSHFRSKTVPPLGTVHIPDSPGRFFLFLTGAQYGTARLHAPAFYLERVVEHTRVFSRSFLWVGMIIGLLGLRFQWKQQRSILCALLLAFGANMGYFTTYAATDYHTMVAPSYAIFSLWIACGIHTLSGQSRHLPKHLATATHLAFTIAGTASITAALASDRFGIGKPGFGRAQTLLLAGGLFLLLSGFAISVPGVIRWLRANAARIATVLASSVVLTGLVGTQLPTHLARKRSAPVTVFVLSSFEVLPEGSMVVAGWDKLAPLLYFQRVCGLRQDLTIVEPISEWQRHVYERKAPGPVMVDTIYDLTEDVYEFRPWPHGWYYVVLALQS